MYVRRRMNFLITVLLALFVLGISYFIWLRKNKAIKEVKNKIPDRRKTMRSITRGLKELKLEGNKALNATGAAAEREAHQERAAYVQKQMEETAKKYEYSTSKKEKMGRF